jgi:hypothetical protein
MNRLYVLENRYTLTGGMADHRKALPASLIPAAAALIASELGDASAKALADTAPAGLKEWIAPAVRDLIDNKGKSLVLAGSRSAQKSTRSSLDQQRLGAYGSTIELLQTAPAPEMGGLPTCKRGFRRSGQDAGLPDACQPLLRCPGRSGVRQARHREKVKLVHVGTLKNSTARHARCTFRPLIISRLGAMRVPQTAPIPIVQPMIAPLYDGASKIEVLLGPPGPQKARSGRSCGSLPLRCALRPKTPLTRRFATPLPLWRVVSTKRSGISPCATVSSKARLRQGQRDSECRCCGGIVAKPSLPPLRR